MTRRVAAPVVAVALAAGLTGCTADGSNDGNVTARHPGVPFEYRVPAEFTAEHVDWGNSRGAVRGVRALDKVNVIAVRRVPAEARARAVRLRVLGEAVTSDVVPVAGRRGWALECQYTEARREKVLEACRLARRTVQARSD